MRIKYFQLSQYNIIFKQKWANIKCTNRTYCIKFQSFTGLRIFLDFMLEIENTGYQPWLTKTDTS